MVIASKLCSLQSLRIANSRASYSGIRTLAAWVPGIQILDLDYCSRFTNAGLVAIAQGLNRIFILRYVFERKLDKNEQTQQRGAL